LAGESILLVDDDELIHKMVGSYLMDAGFAVQKARDGMQALQVIRTGMPDLVLTDVNMPALNGYELTRRLRAHYKTAHMPIIMFSVKSEAEDILTGYAEGADDYLPKPFDLQLLVAKVQALLARRAAARELSQAGKVILFMHAKGGVGTTTIAVNLGMALAAMMPTSVGILDLNLEFANTFLHMNLRPARTLADLAEERDGPIDEEAFEAFVTRNGSDLQLVLGCDNPVRAELVTLPAVQLAIERMRARTDYLLIDTSDGFSEPNLAAMDHADLICVVTSPTRPALKATRDCLAVLDQLKVPRHQQLVILNCVGKGANRSDAARFLERPVDHLVAHNEGFDDAANLGQPLVTTDLETLATSLAGTISVGSVALPLGGRD
jgi:pilus assembly protein CpaE